MDYERERIVGISKVCVQHVRTFFYGTKMESVWLGHSEKTAMEHYLMVTDEDYAIAAGKG